jgi:NAD+ kinase
VDIKTVGICLKRGQPQAANTVKDLIAWLEARGLEVRMDPECAACVGGDVVEIERLVSEVDLIIMLGGDGTLLGAARAIGQRRVPILGVNLGTLGFLTEVNAEEMFDALETVLAGEAEVLARMRLEVAVRRGGKEVERYIALNDAVSTKTALSRMILLEAFADDERVTTYHADGLIVSTPTGSTAYSLSAGGPIVLPELEAIVLTPICPHSLTQRPLVLPATSEIELVVHTRGGEANLTIDGQVGMELADGDCVLMSRSQFSADIIASPIRTRFEILQTKLRWGQR